MALPELGDCTFATLSTASGLTRPTTPKLATGVIVYLAQAGAHSSYGGPGQKMALETSLASLYTHYNERFRDPVWIFHEGDFTQADQARITAGRNETAFKLLPPSFYDLPAGLNTSNASRAAWKGAARFSIGYRCMIQWYATGLYDYMVNEKVEWVWRMDDDSYLHSPITYHMFSFMAVNRFAYAFRQMVVDVTDGFAETVRDFVDLTSAVPRTLYEFATPPSRDGLHSARRAIPVRKRPPSGPWTELRYGPVRTGLFDRSAAAVAAAGLPEWSDVLDLSTPPVHGWSGLGYYNNFFVGSVRFFTSRPVQRFLRYMERTHMIFKDRLNDLQIQSIAVQLFLSRRRVAWLVDFSYSHATLDRRPVPAAKAASAPAEKIECGGLSIGTADPRPNETAAKYRALHGEVMARSFPVFGTGRCLPRPASCAAEHTPGLFSLAHALCQCLVPAERPRDLFCMSAGRSIGRSDGQPPAMLGHPRGLAVQSAGALYLPVPKAMSTTLRNIMMLDETSLINSSSRPASLPALLATQAACWKPKIACKKLPANQCCAGGLTQLPAAAEQIDFSFAVTRDPLARFLSAFREIQNFAFAWGEIHPGRWWSHSVAERQPFWGVASADLRFAQFVQDAVTSGGGWDAHVLQQGHFLTGLGLDFVGRMEEPATMRTLMDGVINASATPADARPGLLAAYMQRLDERNAANRRVALEENTDPNVREREAQEQREMLMRRLPPLLRARWCGTYLIDYERYGYWLPGFCHEALHAADVQLRAAATSSPSAHFPQSFFSAEQPPLPVMKARGVAAVLLSHNHEAGVRRLATALDKTQGLAAVVVVEDGSTDNSPAEWRAAVGNATGAMRNAQIVHADNLHELRAYNFGVKAALKANHSGIGVFCFLQDDDVPTEARWAENAHYLLQKYRAERLAFLTGRGAAYCGVEIAPQPIDRPKELQRKSKNRGAIPYIDPTTDTPFMFTIEAWLAPMCVRRDVFELLGGFDETLASPGEPVPGLDTDLTVRGWMGAGYTSGIYDAAFLQGVGGHGTAASAKSLARRVRNRDSVYKAIRKQMGCTRGRWPGKATRHINRLNERLLEPRASESCELPLCNASRLTDSTTPSTEATRKLIQRSCQVSARFCH